MEENGTYHWIWSEYFWFPAASEKLGLTQHGWKHLQNQPGSGLYFPEISDLNWSILLGVVLLVVRYIFETLLVVPLATKLGLAKKKRPVTPNTALEMAYKQHKRINNNNIVELSKQTDLTRRQVEVWMRRRSTQDAPTKLQKVKECSWHMLFYGVFCVYGLIVLWDFYEKYQSLLRPEASKPWFTETKNCWVGWPMQHIPNDIYWYYILELAFYWSLIFTLFTDHRRKDFVEMLIHHFATMTLLYFSWVMNFVRVGTLVLLVHDAADPWLAPMSVLAGAHVNIDTASKMGIYLKKHSMTDICFCIFLLMWIISRLVIFPFVVLYTTTIESYTYLSETTYGGQAFFNFFLYVLQALHLLWTYSICRILYNRLVGHEVEDVRSDDDSSDAAEFQDEHERERSKINGNGIGDLGCHTSGVINGTLRSNGTNGTIK